MQCELIFRGVPIGEFERAVGGLCVAQFSQTEHYRAVRAEFSAGWKVLFDAGWSHPEGTRSRLPIEAISRLSHSGLEIRDDLGRLIPTNFIVVMEWEIVSTPPVVVASFLEAFAGRPADIVPKVRGESGQQP
jgi:hypothetical protein